MAVRQEVVDISMLYTHTWQNYNDTMTDNIFKSTKFLKWLMGSSKIRQDKKGGTHLEYSLEYADSDGATTEFAGTAMDMSTQITAAKALDLSTTIKVNWRNMGGVLVNRWEDVMQNEGEPKIRSLIDTKISNMEKTLKKRLNTQLLGLNNHSTDKTFEGIQNWVRAVPNPAYASRYTQGEIAQGEISLNSGTYNNTWWNNKMSDMTTLNVAVNLENYMRTMWNNCSDGEETPDLLLTTQAIYELYEAQLGEIHQVMDNGEGDLGFKSLRYKGAPFIWESGVLSYAMYFLNSNYLYLNFDPRCVFTLGRWKDDQNDEDQVAKVLTRGNLVCTNRSMQGIIKNIGN